MGSFARNSAAATRQRLAVARFSVSSGQVDIADIVGGVCVLSGSNIEDSGAIGVSSGGTDDGALISGGTLVSGYAPSGYTVTSATILDVANGGTAGGNTSPLDGVNYVADLYGSYADANSLASLDPVGVNTVALTADFGIDAQNSTVYQNDVPGGYTESNANIAATIDGSLNQGLSVMVRPLVDFLPGNYDTAPGQTNPLNGSYSADEWRSYYNPSNVAGFFASYQTMIVDEATVAQANGATLFCIGTELDQLTGPAYETYWDNIISAVRSVFSGRLTYAADWDDDVSPLSLS